MHELWNYALFGNLRTLDIDKLAYKNYIDQCMPRLGSKVLEKLMNKSKLKNIFQTCNSNEVCLLLQSLGLAAVSPFQQLLIPFLRFQREKHISWETMMDRDYYH